MHRFVSLMFGVLFIYTLNGQSDDRGKIWQDGVDFMMKGDYLLGMENMNRFINLSPLNTNAIYNRGICRFYMGDEERGCFDLLTARSFGFKKNGGFIQYYCDPEFKLKLLKNQFYKDITIYKDHGYRPIYTMADSLRGALRIERSCFDVYFYNLTVRIHPNIKEIEGINDIWFKGVSECREIQIDLFDNYTIKKISLDSNILNYRREYNAIFIEMPELVQPKKDYKITVEYSGKPLEAPNPPWDGGFVWSHDRRLNRWAGVACEHLGASSWWPNKDHLSDKPDSMSINIEVPRNYEAICNGSLSRVVSVNKKYDRYEWFVHYPINNYNVTFYMGKYTEFTDTLYWQSDTLVLRYHVLPYHLEKAKEHFRQTKDIVAFYNDAFGQFPFPKDNFRMVESPFEGMEHQTAIAYGASFNNLKNSKTYLSKKFDYIIVHEAAHEWWGNSVVVGDMTDIWIHEGFATYSEFLFLEHKLGYEESIVEMHNHMNYIYNVWPLVQNRNVNEDAFAGSDVYYKGAIMLQCLRATIDNDTLFKNMLRDFHLQYRFKVVDSQDFIDFVNNYTEHNFTPLFKIFLYDTSLPILEYSYKRIGDDLLLHYRWTKVDEGFEMPFSIETIGEKKAYRIIANTAEQDTIIENASSFTFYNLHKSPEGCPHNGMTYYWTKCLDVER